MRNSRTFQLRHSHRYGRRRGQALLLAVLVMIFAALIGSTFITVVAINIGQTSREEERDKARQAALSGLAFINTQLTESTQATRWRPINEVQRFNGTSGVPQPGDPDYIAYWTAFDQAQGWSGDGQLVKFPDPRSPNPNLSAANYMGKVEKVDAGDVDNQNGDKTGALRITVIGLSSDDPSTFYRTVAYKAGPAQQPLTAAMRSVSNWDFVNQTVPRAEANAAGSAGTTLNIQNLQGALPPVPFYITRGNAVGGGNLQGHLVIAASSSTFTLSPTTPILGSVINGERVEIAAALGAPAAVDYNNDGTANPDPAAERVDYRVSSASTPGSSLVNGGLIFSGFTFLQNLRDPQQANASQALGTVKASGLIYTPDPTVVVDGTFSNGTATGQRTLVSSNTGDFPFAGAGTPEQKTGLVTDGLNRIAGNSASSVRTVQPFTPPSITAGGDGFGRYRQLTKYSASSDPSNPQGAAHGYGEGIYLNNSEDRERKRTGTSGHFADMSQSDLLNLWFNPGPDSANAALRLSEPSTTTAATASLEEMHFRGWVSPNEFRARGALIELDPENSRVHITLDSRSDGRAFTYPNGSSNVYPFQGPVPGKGWRDPDGTLAGDNTVGGVYQQTFNWPANGVIFAEGNVRIRGGAFNAAGNANTGVDPGRSLTVVSMNNIYIEGSLNAGSRKVMLLAKKNVVMNPTSAIQKGEVHTRLRADTSTTSTTISVHDASGFRSGDEIMIGANNLRRVVASVDTGSNTLTLASAPTARTSGEVVRLVEDPLRNDNRVYHQYATRVSRFSDVLHRRIYLRGTNSEMRLVFRHNAERRDALTVTTEQAEPDTVEPDPPQLESATLAYKLADNAQTTIIQPGQKVVDIAFDDTATSGNDTFPGTPPDDENAALAYRVGEATDSDTAVDDDDLAEEINKERIDPAENWNYSATVNDNYDQNTGVLRIPPAHFLAAVGNKPDLDPATALVTYPLRKDIFVGSEYTIPMATSVLVGLNNLQQTLRNDYFNTTLNSFEFVKQFGFNFTYGAGATPPGTVDDWEDVLTVDQSFYRNGTGTKTEATYDNTAFVLDSRTLTNGVSGGWNSLAIRLDPQVSSYFDATSPPDPTPSVPYYRLSRLKLENNNALNGSHQFETLQPGYTFDVRAYVYAQEGSWMVIPGGYYDEHVHTDSSGVFLDLPDASGNYNQTRDVGENADLDRDGVVSRAEQIAAYRFLRNNYQVNFTGAIMEKQTAAIQDPDGAGPLVGHVSEWTDKLATVRLTAADWSGTGAGDTLVAGAPSYANGNFGTINYVFDDAAARDAIDNDLSANQTGFHPPISSELLYQTG